MPHIAKDAAPTFTIPGLTVTGFAAPSRGATETSLWMIELAPGAPATPHTMDREEVFVALAGRATATVAEREHDVSAGEALIVPAGETFALANPHGEPFRAVVALPVGGRARLADGDAFIPPWAE
ncbi:MAG TPA: cupin domain-containing protein [Gaiellales bacterium]|nr:cupin domain-containing protein [Gaiellales bacterium]